MKNKSRKKTKIDSYLQVLKMTQGTWAKDFTPESKKKRKLELAESKRGKKM